MNILIPRPKEDGERLKELLEQQGFECLLAPVLKIKATGNKPTIAEDAKPDAVVVTSRHAFLKQKPIDAPLYVVGEVTAREAKKLGWPSPKIVAENHEELIKKMRLSKGSSVVYLRGEDVSADLPEALPNYEWQEVITYCAEAQTLNKRTQTALTSGKVHAVVFFSKRTVSLFEEACAGLTLPPLAAFCLSKKIANTLTLDCWKHKHVAAIPSKASLIDALHESAIALPMNDDLASELPSSKPSPWIKLCIGLLFLIQVAMGIGLYALLKQRFTPLPASTVSRDNTAALKAQKAKFADFDSSLEELRSELTNIQDSLDTLSPSSSGTLRKLKERIKTLEERPIQSAKSGQATQAQLQRIDEMTQQVRELKQHLDANGAAQWEIIQLLTSFDRLEERVLTSEPYIQALEAFRIAAANQPESALWVRSLHDYQHDGMPSINDLTQRFIAARDATLADNNGDSESSFWQDVKHNLTNLVRIRKTGGSHSGDDVASILARAEYALEQQEYEQMQEELSSLPQSAHVYFDELKAAIHGRQELLQTLDIMRANLTAQVEVR